VSGKNNLNVSSAKKNSELFTTVTSGTLSPRTSG
jgi:hypothetical protein